MSDTTGASVAHTPVSSLVTADWLAAHRGGVVILDASIRRTPGLAGKAVFSSGLPDFEAEHIPGALFADIFEAFSDPQAPFAFTRPTAAHLEATLAALGIGSDTAVVVYDRNAGAWAARIWWVLRSYGFDAVSVLNGGLGAWVDAGQTLEYGGQRATETPSPTTAFVATDRAGYFVGLDTMTGIASGDDITPALCGVRLPEFTGADGGARAGHIPNTQSLPYPDLLDEEGLISLEKARAAASALNLFDTPRTILYCGGAINAAGLALALSEVGVTGLTLYDGSLTEWRANPDLPLATGPATPTAPLGAEQ